MEIYILIIFAWFLFILGKFFKDFTITFLSGILMVVGGVALANLTGRQDIIIIAMTTVHWALGFYIIFRSIIEITNVYGLFLFDKKKVNENKKRKMSNL